MNSAASVAVSLSLLLVASYPARAVLHPELVNPRIVECKKSSNYECGSVSKYGSDGTMLVDVQPAVTPNPRYSKVVVAYGMHCDRGDGLTGVPFTGCTWVSPSDPRTQHAPVVSNCSLKSTDSWELSPGSTCDTPSIWGGHVGAGPGGECVVFAQKGQSSGPALHTIRGVISAVTAANAGSVFCQKMLPPNVQCDIDLPSVIDHGSVAPTSASSVQIQGRVDCGSNPVITIVGGERVVIAAGITTRLTHTITGDGALRIASELVAVNGVPGSHQASVIIRVSPY